MECVQYPKPGEHLDDGAITRILTTHKGLGRRLRVPAHHMQPHHRNALDDWLMSEALNRLQELEFYHRCDNANLLAVSKWLPPPAGITRFAPTLHAATFSHCKFSDRASRLFRFPSLKMLALEEAVFSETSVRDVLDGCPVLENLLLRGNVGPSRVRIVSHSIKSIAIFVSSFRGGAHLQELVVEDAPCLERLIRTLPDRDLRVTVTKAPRLETLGCLSDVFGVTNLKLGSAVILRSNDIKLTEAVSLVKILAFSNNTLSLDMVINFMECFPCLERLCIKSISGEKNVWHKKHRDRITRHDIRLKNLVLKNYQGTRSEINFATFILNARLLEYMRFEVGIKICIDESWTEDQRRRLLLDKRTSRCAQFEFRKYGCPCNFTHVESVHDLSVADPFACRC